MAPTLQIDNLTFRYRDRDTPAIEGIQMSVDEGELVLLAGASGCGKTTLIRAINGLIPRSYKGDLRGAIRVAGEDTSEMKLAEISQQVGTLLQDPERQILGTKVINEVAFGLENLGLERTVIQQRAEAALERLNIIHLRDRETHLLSGGEKQKVALAGVLAMEPKLLLLDEPLASLDPASAQDALRTVRQLVDGGMSVLLVEHRVEEVLRIEPRRLLYMEAGQIRFSGGIKGLQAQVDYHEIKLPAEMLMARASEDPAPEPFVPKVPRKGHNQDRLVAFDQVGFGYEQGPEVLHDVSLSIAPGDIIAVLGPNGAGKTTLVKHAIGLLSPRRGRVLIEGRDTTNLSIAEIASTLGYVFQSPSHMLFAPSVGEELSFGPRNLGHAEDDINKEVAYAIKIMNLTGMKDDPPLALSFGQQKRVSIGAILAMQSRILVMDEPTAGQDYKNYMSFMDSILQTPGFEAILFITHDIDLAVVYANRVWLMSEGSLVADGPPEEVLADYDRLAGCNLVPTSLLQANLERIERSGGFLRAEALAHVAAG